MFNLLSIQLKSCLAVKLPHALIFCLIIVAFSLSNALAANNRLGLNLPEYTVKGEDSVDVMSNHVNLVVPSGSIGHGELSLSRQMSSGYHGFTVYNQNNYNGFIFNHRKPNPNHFPDATLNNLSVKEVVVGFATHYFEISGNDFIPLSDERLSLIKMNNEYIFTDVDGSEYFFFIHTFPVGSYNGQSSSIEVAYLSQIVKPNGFTISIHRDDIGQFGSLESRFRIRGVTTNNGLQLKYLFNESYNYHSQDRAKNWFTLYPENIIAINNAENVYCPIYATNCSQASTWPTWNFSWPNGIPYTALNGLTRDFVVTNPQNQETRYTHKVIPIEGYLGTPPSPITNYNDIHISAIKYPSDTEPSVTYEYHQVLLDSAYPIFSGPTRHEPSVVKSFVKGRVRTYQYPYLSGNTPVPGIPEYQANSGGDLETIKVNFNSFYGYPLLIDYRDKRVYFQGFNGADSYRKNKVSSISYSRHDTTNTDTNTSYNGVSFKYETRGNLTQRRQLVDYRSDDSVIVENAHYPSTCSNPKTCNQPTWVKDGRGNQTDYTYHAASGMVATITKPADENGIRPQTRFYYQQYYARFINPETGVMESSSAPIWLMSSQEQCIKGAASGNSCALGASDEVVTTYYYGDTNQPNNLWLKGQTVTADGKSLTTCYQYDKFGNRIGETQPKSGLSTCL